MGKTDKEMKIRSIRFSEAAMTDEEYARMLQREYDREFDISVTMEQQQQTQNTSGGKKGKKTWIVNWLLRNSHTIANMIQAIRVSL